MFINMHTYAYMHTDIHACMHAHTRTHTHTHTTHKIFMREWKTGRKCREDQHLLLNLHHQTLN